MFLTLNSNNTYFDRFLYVGNRGHNSIAVFRVDQSSGTLSLVDIQDSHGAFPRHFNFDRTSQFLVVGNHASDNIVGRSFVLSINLRNSHENVSLTPFKNIKLVK